LENRSESKCNTASFDIGYIDGKSLQTSYFYLGGESVYILTVDFLMLIQYRYSFE